jgi:hypothetical protein
MTQPFEPSAPKEFKTSRRSVIALAKRNSTLVLATTLVGAIACSGGGEQQIDKTGTVSTALNTAPKIADFVLYAERSVILGSSNQVSGGDIGVRDPAPASFGPQVKVGSLSTVQFSNNILASSVSITNAQVGGVETNAQTNNGVVIYGQQGPFPAAAMPPLPSPALPAAGTTAVTVPAFTIQSLNPGTYGALNVTGTLQLYAGTYTFTNVNLATFAHFAVQTGPVVVNVTGTFTAAQGVTILPPLGQSASNLTINVAGADASSTSPAVSIGLNSTINAILAAPHGTVSFGNGVAATGAFSGYDVSLGSGVKVAYQNGFVASASNPHGSQQLSGYLTAAIAAAPVVGPVPPSTSMHVSIGLPGINPTQIQAAVQSVSDPTSSQYRQYLAPADFANDFGATASDYNKVVTWAGANGLTVTTYPNRLIASVSGTAGALEKALFVNFDYRQMPDGTQFFAPDQDPSLNLGPSVLRISGMDNMAPVLDSDVTPNGNGPKGTYSSADLRAAYAPCTALDGTGQVVGVFETDGFVTGDVQAYDGTIAGNHSYPLSTVLIDGYDGTPDGRLPSETPGDLEMVFAMAPGAQVYSFEGPAARSLATENDTLAVMATYSPLPTQISNSRVFLMDANTQNLVDEFALQGQSFFSSSGDLGQYTSDPLNRRDLANVTMVGGTILTLSSPSAITPYGSETTWPGSGGGILPSVTIPWYQVGFGTTANGGSTQFRMVPDVSLVATGLEGNQAGSINLTGTSFSTPLWTGFTALINEQGANVGLKPVGFLSPALYNIAKTPALYAASFHDIQDNSTNPSSDKTLSGFQAVTGYDLATGLGSFGCGLIAELDPPPNQGSPTGGGSPPPAPSIAVGTTITQGGGPDICTTGNGFTPGATVTVSYAGIPNYPNPSPGDATAVVGPDGKFILKDTGYDTQFQNSCNVPAVNFQGVTITATDGSRGTVGTGRQVVDSMPGIPASIFCDNDGPQGTDYNGGCH